MNPTIRLAKFSDIAGLKYLDPWPKEKCRMSYNKRAKLTPKSAQLTHFVIQT